MSGAQAIERAPKAVFGKGGFAQDQGVTQDWLGALAVSGLVHHQERLCRELPELNGHRDGRPRGCLEDAQSLTDMEQISRRCRVTLEHPRQDHDGGAFMVVNGWDVPTALWHPALVHSDDFMVAGPKSGSWTPHCHELVHRDIVCSRCDVHACHARFVHGATVIRSVVEVVVCNGGPHVGKLRRLEQVPCQIVGTHNRLRKPWISIVDLVQYYFRYPCVAPSYGKLVDDVVSELEVL